MNILCVALLTFITFSSSVKGNWDELASSLGSKESFQIAQVDDWLDQCVSPFADLVPPQVVSNYQLFEQPSGMCMDIVTCAYENCDGPVEGLYPKDPTNTFSSSEHPRDEWKSYEGLNLPAAVVHPVNVGDISATIKYAIKNNIGLSVKTSGHSYVGASTKKGTILLNLSKLQKYSPTGSIVECNSSEVQPGAYQEACELAVARNKDAVLRVGGGEIFDEALRAVSVDWNNNNDKKYHLVSGASGTVSAAGGWLASGGLSGNNGMRLFGVGVDQVLHVEMVLPSGTHVRFGPSQWEDKEGNLYPITTAVTGYCNVGDLTDESKWDWTECEEEINFSDLWYAVRGGGGGTFGVVTSIYYQLHEYYPMESVYYYPSAIMSSTEITDEAKMEFASKYVEFVLSFFFKPELLGVTKEDSNSCGSAATGGLFDGFFTCHKDGGSKFMKEAWMSFYGDEFNTTVHVDDYMSIDTSYKTWAEFMVGAGAMYPPGVVPEGRAADTPMPTIVPTPKLENGEHHELFVFPYDAVVEKTDLLIPLLVECAYMIGLTCTPGYMYIQGGMIPAADDGLNSFPPGRRHAGFMTHLASLEMQHKFYQVFYGADGAPVSGANHPGGLSHNHATLDFPTPLKSDWTTPCEPSWSDEKKAEMCYSFQEISFGTEGLKKLEEIHTAIDPDRLFETAGGVGYAEVDVSPEVDTSNANKIKVALTGSIGIVCLFLLYVQTLGFHS